MTKNHMKRFTMPNRWSLPIKSYTWAVKPAPGPHKLKDSVPVAVALRDYLHICDSFREAKKALNKRTIKIDGRIVTDPKRGLGLMDVLTLEDSGKNYRILLDKRGKFTFLEIPADNATWKLCKITSKTTIKKGLFQLGLHDGRSIVLDPTNAKKYHCGDTIKLQVPEQKILAHYPMKMGFVSYIIGGKHAGKHAPIVDIEIVKSSLPNRVHLEGDVSTILDYIFVVGKSHPEIVLPEV